MVEKMTRKTFLGGLSAALLVEGPRFSWAATVDGKPFGAGARIPSGRIQRLLAEALAPVTDLWLYDIKGLDAERHKKNIGVDTTVIHANLRWLDEKGAKIQMRCPMIPGVNDSEADLKALGAFADTLKNVPSIEIEPYDAYGIDKAHKLGLKVYEAPSAPPSYKGEIVSRLSRYTKKRVTSR